MAQTWQDYFEYHGDYLPQHEDYFTPERTKSEVQFLVEHVIPSKSSRILDLACGQGRHAIALTKMGYHVLGVDRSEQLLSMALAAAEKAGTSMTFVKQDMRELNVGQTFDVIMVLFCTFGIESDEINRKTLLRLSNHLKPGGRLFLDMHNLFRFVRRMGRAETNYAKLDLKELTLWDKTSIGLELPLRLYTVPEMTERLNAVGLKIVTIWGDYNPQKAHYDFDSERLLILAQKA